MIPPFSREDTNDDHPSVLENPHMSCSVVIKVVTPQPAPCRGSSAVQSADPSPSRLSNNQHQALQYCSALRVVRHIHLSLTLQGRSVHAWKGCNTNSLSAEHGSLFEFWAVLRLQEQLRDSAERSQCPSAVLYELQKMRCEEKAE